MLRMAEREDYIDSQGEEIEQGFYRDSLGTLVYFHEFSQSGWWMGYSTNGDVCMTDLNSNSKDYTPVNMRTLKKEHSLVLRALEENLNQD